MAIETLCAGCGQKLAVADEHAGKQARCPACGQVYTVPHPSGPVSTGPHTTGADAASVDAANVEATGAEAASAEMYSAGSGVGADRGSDSGVSPAEPNPALAETVAGVSPSASGGLQSFEQFWMRTADGAEYGPVDRPNLNRWFSEGRVGPGYTIRQGNDGPWQPAEVFRPHGNMYPAGTPQVPSPSLSPSDLYGQSSAGHGAVAQDTAGGPLGAGGPAADRQLPAGSLSTPGANYAGPAASAGQPNAFGTSGQPISINPASGAYSASVGGQFGGAARFAKPDPSGLVLTMGIVSWVCLLICAPIGWIPGLVAWISGKRGLADIQSGQADPSNVNLVQVGYYLGMANVILTLLSAVLGAALIAIGIIADM